MKWMNKSVFMVYLLLCIFLLIACSHDSRKKSETAETNEVKEIKVSIERHPPATDYTGIFGKLDKLPEEKNSEYDIRSTDLSGSDLSKEYDKLLQATFDSKTVWPDKLPDGFNPEEIMEKYKNPGLNIRSLHEKGITGKGVGIAIIDQPLLTDHIEYKDQLKYYSERDTVKTQAASMHGAAVASIAVGKSVGVAPEANLYYIADDFSRVKDDYSLLAESINKLLDINKTLPGENRIRVISISWGYDMKTAKGSEELNKAYKRAEDEGVLVITTSLNMREDMDFFGLDKVPLSDPDDFNSYLENQYEMNTTYNISVPMNYRCTASPTGTEDYVVYREGGASWTVPYVAGLYALACQVKPEITYREFWKLASETSRTSEGTYNGKAYSASYIVDPVALIKELEKK